MDNPSDTGNLKSSSLWITYAVVSPTNFLNRDELNKLTNCGVAQAPVWLEGSHFSYISGLSQRVPVKSCSGKNNSSVAHWFLVEKTPW
jgi:hypothetical protein